MAYLGKPNELVDHLFRQESGKMVAVLVNIFGSQHLELAEDVVQSTLIKALENWKFNGIPDKPTAWLYRVAKNQTIDIIRREKRNSTFDFSEPDQKLLTSEYTISQTLNSMWEENQIRDDFLGMMFACCHHDISSENQVTFILKTLCGFSTKEVAKAFMTTEGIISKRIYRTKEHFRKNNIRPSLSNVSDLENKIATVASAIYLIFNEGYNSTHVTDLVRRDLISQALFLCRELLENDQTNLSEINALMALMCFHTARIDSRISAEGDIILLKDQDRSLWERELIAAGQVYLARSGAGNRISMYHFEALIAMEHCVAKTYETTNWEAILRYYEQMLELQYDPVVHLNKCLVILQVKGAKAALVALKELESNKHIQGYYLYYASLGEICMQLEKVEEAKSAIKKAISLTKSENEKVFLLKKLDEINN